ncbi:alpha/beta fold hydrolase [Pseudonocardia xinjiangensis]|uniref:alpha/beta fold hydrolase n=1 Tax=Pseudonocardia xinjiangensis TaxID=75289 RepID=UPI003D945B14
MPDVSEDMVRMSDGAALWVATAAGPAEEDLPGLVFLHGGAGMWDYLEPVSEMVDGTFRTHRYDQRGCGRSSASDGYDLARYVADLDELRQHFGYERWYVFGHSFGATLGIEYAATHGQRVAALIYCSGVGIGWSTHRATYKARQRARLSDADYERREELEARDRTWAEEVEWRTLSWLPDFVDPETARDWASVDARTPLPLNMACNRAFSAETSAWSNDEERARWGAVECPVWIVHGEADPRPADGPRALAGVLPQARFYEVADAGHQPWRERPDVIAQVLAGVAADASRQP